MLIWPTNDFKIGPGVRLPSGFVPINVVTLHIFIYMCQEAPFPQTLMTKPQSNLAGLAVSQVLSCS